MKKGDPFGGRPFFLRVGSPLLGDLRLDLLIDTGLDVSDEDT